MWQTWLIISGVFFIFEIITTGFLVFWLAIGAILAAIVSLFTSNIVIQTAVFVISSGLMIFLTRPFIEKYAFHKKETSNYTNAFSIIGKIGIVTEDIDIASNSGQIKINGEVWSAKSNVEHINQGTEVTISSIEGVKAIVEPVHAVSK